jgi:hypothetical protein
MQAYIISDFGQLRPATAQAPDSFYLNHEIPAHKIWRQDPSAASDVYRSTGA